MLVDRSKSTASPQETGLVGATLPTILSRLSHGDAVVAAWITDRSETELELAAQREFPLFDPHTDNPLLGRRSRRLADQKLKDDISLL
jgi:hypothetical protein